MSNFEPVVVVHGGAGDLPCAEDRRQYLEGVRGALEVGRAALEQGAEAAVLAAVAYLESETIMNAGRGAALASDGSASLDAGFMHGDSRRYGAVTGVRRCMHPVKLAAKLALEGDFGRFVGPPDADQLAAEFGLPECAPSDLITERTQRIHAERIALSTPQGAPFLDTVGAVALDAQGRLAAGVSTGGMSLKRPGRIGDSPVVGGGFWADDQVGACVTTGVGEVLMRQGTARRCVQLVAEGRDPQSAAVTALDELLDFPGDQRGVSGLIFVECSGRVVLDHNSREMSGGWIRANGDSACTHLWRTS